jgi:hypothetical protein
MKIIKCLECNNKYEGIIGLFELLKIGGLIWDDQY